MQLLLEGTPSPLVGDGGPQVFTGLIGTSWSSHGSRRWHSWSNYHRSLPYPLGTSVMSRDFDMNPSVWGDLARFGG
jgi:hypothetical protein